MTDGPLVSIVIPTWNRAALLGEAITSVLAQKYPRWELIVADDGSTDATAAMLAAQGDPRIRSLMLDHSGNISRVRNAAAAKAEGDFIAFLDSDDLWLPGKLEVQIGALRGSAAGWCYGDYGHIDRQGRPVAQRAGAFRARDGAILRDLLREETAAYVGTLVVRRGLFDRIGGFDETLPFRGDIDFTLRLAGVAEAVAVADSVMLVRDHPARSTAALADPHERTLLVFDRLLARESDPEVRALAQRRRAQILVEAARRRLRAGAVRVGLRRLCAAAVAAVRGVGAARG